MGYLSGPLLLSWNFFCLFVCFWDETSFSLEWLCSQGWPWTFDFPASSSWVLELQAHCLTMQASLVTTYPLAYCYLAILLVKASRASVVKWDRLSVHLGWYLISFPVTVIKYADKRTSGRKDLFWLRFQSTVHHGEKSEQPELRAASHAMSIFRKEQQMPMLPHFFSPFIVWDLLHGLCTVSLPIPVNGNQDNPQ